MEEAGTLQTLGIQISEVAVSRLQGQVPLWAKGLSEYHPGEWEAGGQRGEKDGGRVLLPRRGDEREEEGNSRRFTGSPGCLTVSAENF